ncbi:MAG: tyrosine-type recombinase/integrase [Neoaquamicrobium sediminum]|uniref:tyrosine-type recombinase/integrase n=1 Tax=Neoaquamicrobium sediminum TaxID=1849104 RepID=UPI004035F47F
MPGLWAHRHGLALSISRSGTASWAFRYSAPDGRRRLMTLATISENDLITAATLKAVEVQAERLKLQVRAGHDPLAEKGERKTVETARQQRNTFEEAATRFIAEQTPNWKNEKHAAQWTATLKAYAYSTIGSKAPHRITTQDILDVLRQPYKGTTLWDGARETASRVRMRIEAVLNAEFALNRDHPLHREAWADFRNPAQWKNHLAAIFKASGKRAKEHFAAMAFEDVPAFVAELRGKTDYSAKALLLTILCATRTGETLGATWDEIDLNAATWSIPAERMKAGKEHIVPLSSAAVELLENLPRIDGNRYLFPGAREKKPLSNMAMLMMLRGMREDEQLTVHGFRSAFRDWAGETTLHPDIIAEMALAHTIKDKTIAAYRRGNAFERRRQIMNQWTDYIFLEKLEYVEKWQKFTA